MSMPYGRQTSRMIRRQCQSIPQRVLRRSITGSKHCLQGKIDTVNEVEPISTPTTNNLAAKHAALTKSIKRELAAIKAQATKLERQQMKQLPPRVAPSAYNPHHDLASFLAYVKEYNLKTNTTVYKGTLYEYTVAEALKTFGMVLKRVGKSDDRGIDLVGHWSLPADPSSMRMLVQCKMTKTMPSLIRELEGSYTGAPSGWNDETVLAVLASRFPASPGTQQAMQRSKYPLGFVQVDLEGIVRQFVWNQAANDHGLNGVGVVSEFHTGDDESQHARQPEASIALTWLGDTWPVSEF